MIFGVEGVDPERRERLIELLEIDLEWRLNKVSDGQRRRVQICMGLLKPYEVRRSLALPADATWGMGMQALEPAWMKGGMALMSSSRIPVPLMGSGMCSHLPGSA